jgi:amino acid transporter
VVLGIRGTSNPLANAELADLLAPVLSLASVLLVVIFILCAASLVIRFRRSHGDERQQIKLFAFSASMIAGFILMGNVAEALTGGSDDGLGDRIAITVFPVLLSGIPLAVGVAILRYRLYDIDRIISRTLAYSVLTAVLVGGYLLTVLALQSVLPVSEDSPLVTAVSTLGVVAAFGPLRARIQRAMDHRFNRGRYDAERVIAQFGNRLRNEVQLESLSRDLIGVVRTTIHPAHVSLWLREGETGRG